LSKKNAMQPGDPAGVKNASPEPAAVATSPQATKPPDTDIKQSTPTGRLTIRKSSD
jgi:hypothetical protein